MNKEKIEELAFKDRKELANLIELDLLEIIEFLQLDRKQWINQYSAAHNDYVDLQQENKKLKEELEEYKKEKQEWINLLYMFKNQQKEFVNYLENMLDDENDIFSVVRVKDVLQKYKSIIGVSDEKSNNISS